MAERTVGDLVAKQNPLFVERGQTVRAAAMAMKERRVGAVAVVENGRLVGMFTERDVMVRVVADGRDPDSTTVEAVMTANPQSMPPTGDIGEALDRMVAGHFRHMPVVAEGRFVGMLSIRDIPIELRWMRQNWHAARAVGRRQDQ